MQTVVIDARAHMLGRLASIVAKQILSGHHVVRSDLVQQRAASSYWNAMSSILELGASP